MIAYNVQIGDVIKVEDSESGEPKEKTVVDFDIYDDAANYQWMVWIKFDDGTEIRVPEDDNL
jgi:hypothetical protein